MNLGKSKSRKAEKKTFPLTWFISIVMEEFLRHNIVDSDFIENSSNILSPHFAI